MMPSGYSKWCHNIRSRFWLTLVTKSFPSCPLNCLAPAAAEVRSRIPLRSVSVDQPNLKGIRMRWSKGPLKDFSANTFGQIWNFSSNPSSKDTKSWCNIEVRDLVFATPGNQNYDLLVPQPMLQELKLQKIKQ